MYDSPTSTLLPQPTSQLTKQLNASCMEVEYFPLTPHLFVFPPQPTSCDCCLTLGVGTRRHRFGEKNVLLLLFLYTCLHFCYCNHDLLVALFLFNLLANCTHTKLLHNTNHYELKIDRGKTQIVCSGLTFFFQK